MSTINKIIQSNSETGNGSGLRFIPAQWDETGETVGYDVTTISDTIDDDLGFTVKIRQISSENAYDDLDNPAWTVQVNSSRGGSPEIPCDSLIEAYKTTMMWYAGFCEGRVLQSEKDAVKIAHMMLKNDPGFLGVDEDSMNDDRVKVDDTLNSKSNNTTIINDEFITIPNSNTEGDPGFLGVDEDSMNDDRVKVDDTLNSKSNNTTIINDEFITIPNSNTEGNVTPKKHSIRGLMGWLAGLIY